VAGCKVGRGVSGGCSREFHSRDWEIATTTPGASHLTVFVGLTFGGAWCIVFLSGTVMLSGKGAGWGYYTEGFHKCNSGSGIDGFRLYH